MTKLPAFQFYPGDWRKDPAVQSLEYEERGIWIEMLCLMHESEERGVLVFNGKPATEAQLARLLGVSKEKISSVIEVLISAYVASRRDIDGAIFNRRMVREEKSKRTLHEIKSEAGKKGGNPAFQKGKANPYYEKDNSEKDNQEDNQRDKQKITPSSSTSSSTSIDRSNTNTKRESTLPAVASQSVSVPIVQTKQPGFRPDTIACGEHKHVFLTKPEGERLIAHYGREVVHAKVISLDLSLEAEPAKYRRYKNHYATILKWLQMEGSPKIIKHEHVHKNETKTEQAERDLKRQRAEMSEWLQQQEAEGK